MLPMSVKLTWRGPQVVSQIAQKAADAVTEINHRIEAEAKAELYPGHGKVTGTLQRAIYGDAGRVEGQRVRGKVGVRGVPYALRIHKRYQYIWKGLERVRPRAVGILGQYVRGK